MSRCERGPTATVSTGRAALPSLGTTATGQQAQDVRRAGETAGFLSVQYEGPAHGLPVLPFQVLGPDVGQQGQLFL